MITNEYASINTLWSTNFKNHTYSLNNIGGQLTIQKDNKTILKYIDNINKWVGHGSDGKLITIQWIDLGQLAEWFEIIDTVKEYKGMKITQESIK